jgi:hypothetical protein
MVLVWAAGTATPARAAENVAAELLQMIGARTKVVWSRGSTTENRYDLMVFDTNEGKERVLLANSISCPHPVITPDGKYVLYGDDAKGSPNIFAVDWNGKTIRPVCFAEWAQVCGTVEDPPGTTWVYVHEEGNLFRRQLEKPSVRELVWDKTPTSGFWAFTNDGKSAAGQFPWPTIGVAQLPNGAWKGIAGGCGQGIAPDGSGHVFHMTSRQGNILEHTGILMYDQGGANRRYIDLSKAPLCNGSQIMYPVWVRDDVRFIVYSGPQSGRAGAGVIIGQFNPTFTDVVKFVRVTDPPRADIGPYVWIQKKADPKSLPQPTAGLSVKLLAPQVKRLEQAPQFKPIIESLKNLAATSKNAEEVKEAEEIVKHVENWAKEQLEETQNSLEADDPKAAEAVYRYIGVKFNGLDAGKAAQERMNSKEFQDTLGAWPIVVRAMKAESDVVDVPGTEHSVKNAKFAARNKLKLDILRNAAQQIAQQFPSAKGIAKVNEALARCGLEPIKKAETPAAASADASAATPTQPAAGPPVSNQP